MRKIIILLAFAVASIACGKTESANVEDEGKDCVVSIVPMCEISTSESPMTKTSASSNDLYVVQVYFEGSEFALGFFDDPVKMRLYLKQGGTYCVLMSLVKDAKTLLGDRYCSFNGSVKCEGGNYDWTYGDPFYMGISGYSGNSFYVKTNCFFYNSNEWLTYYSGNNVMQENKLYTRFRICSENIRRGKIDKEYPTCVDWFYGEVNDYTPTGEYSTMEFPLKRTGFKLKYELSGVTDGKVTVKVYNSKRTFIENTTSSKSYESDTQFIAFYDTYSAWKYADNYTENLTVSVTWARGTGITQDLGTKTIQVKRNCLNNIKIKLGSDDQGSVIRFTTEEESSIGSAESNITVKP